MSPDSAAYLAVTLDRLHQLQAEGETSPERKATIIGCPPDLVSQYLAEFDH